MIKTERKTSSNKLEPQIVESIPEHWVNQLFINREIVLTEHWINNTKSEAMYR